MADRAVGPYLVHAWVAPGMLRPGNVHIETLVTQPDGTPIDGCEVVLNITSEQSDVRQMIHAGAALPENQFRHEGIVALNQPGDYTVDVLLLEEGKSVGSTSFQMRVHPVSDAAKAIVQTMLFALLLSGLWLFWQGFRVFNIRVFQ